MPSKVFIGRITAPKGDKGDKGDTGPRGERGEQGLQGLQGLQGDPATVDPEQLAALLASLTIAATHIQGSPSTVWVINHTLPFNPAVTVVDSSGRLVEGSVQYLSPTSIQVTFSSGFSGNAYLS